MNPELFDFYEADKSQEININTQFIVCFNFIFDVEKNHVWPLKPTFENDSLFC